MKKHFNIRLEEELINKFKETAKANRTTATFLITEWIEKYCNNEGEIADEGKEDEETTELRSAIESVQERLTQLEGDEQTTELRSAIESIQKQLTRLEEDSKDKATTEYLESVQERLTRVEEDSKDKATTGYVEEKLSEEWEGVRQEINSSRERIRENLEGTICDPFKMEPQPAKEEVDDQEEVKQEETQTEPKYKELNQAELARRLKVSAGTVRNHIRDKGDGRWSKRRDPDGLIWKFDEDKKTYRAIVTNSN